MYLHCYTLYLYNGKQNNKYLETLLYTTHICENYNMLKTINKYKSLV
jgi:hypothetical protein